jgi:hypothetical protein
VKAAVPRTLNEINAGIDEVLDGRVRGRVVLEL